MILQFKVLDDAGHKIPNCYKHLLHLRLVPMWKEYRIKLAYEMCEYDPLQKVLAHVKVDSHKAFTLNKVRYKKDELKGMEYTIFKTLLERVA